MTATPMPPADVPSITAQLVQLIQGSKIARHLIAIAAGYLAARFGQDAGTMGMVLTTLAAAVVVLGLSFWSAWNKDHNVNNAMARTKVLASALLSQGMAAVIGYVGANGDPSAAGVLAAINYTISAAHRPDGAAEATPLLMALESTAPLQPGATASTGTQLNAQPGFPPALSAPSPSTPAQP